MSGKHATRAQVLSRWLLQVLQEHRSRPAKQILDEIINSAKNHAREEPQADDMTVVVVKRVG